MQIRKLNNTHTERKR